jgi:hypothetical protein
MANVKCSHTRVQSTVAFIELNVKKEFMWSISSSLVEAVFKFKSMLRAECYEF